ncbi:MAG TPA: DegT/DnrJ/EryC1/StrS family aminotransferase [Candidatus Rubrimentiphilum sp.]|nr:DegT/DnrJ/EryC1/StrS family aminotransferase [Candidatus Rubrimentiphilum sp.]
MIPAGIDRISFTKPFMDEAEASAAADAIRSGWIVGGPRLAEFEKRFAVLCGAKHAIGVSSWTTGAFLVLHAWGIGPGDEVIVPSLTFIASVNVIAHTGATPVFVDVDPRTWNIDPQEVERKITPATRAIMPIDQIGLPCDVEEINAIARRSGLNVLEDAACAFASRNRGRPVGALADVTVFSLHARKVISTAEGGVITTDDDELAERLRRLAHQGMSLSAYARHTAPPTVFENYPEIGYNFRITDIQAAIGNAQLGKLAEILERRARVAQRYNDYLRDHPAFIAPYVPEGVEHNWQTYQIAVREGCADRNAVMEYLFEHGIPTRRGVMASHLEPPYRSAGVSLPHTEKAAGTTLQLPMHPALTTEQQEYILETLDEL